MLAIDVNGNNIEAFKVTPESFTDPDNTVLQRFHDFFNHDFIEGIAVIDASKVIGYCTYLYNIDLCPDDKNKCCYFQINYVFLQIPYRQKGISNFMSGRINKQLAPLVSMFIDNSEYVSSYGHSFGNKVKENLKLCE